MAIADIEKTTFDMYGKVQDRAGRDVRQVHIAAVIIRLQRRDRLDLGEIPRVPMNGWYGSVILSLQRTPSLSTCMTLTRSGKGGLSNAVDAVPTRPPNSGMMQVLPAGCAPLVSTA